MARLGKGPMNDRKLRPDSLVMQQAIRAKCVHPGAAIGPFEPPDLEQSIPALFARSARRFRDRVAVKTAAEALTYEELDQASDHLARAILARRGPDAEPVALLFDKSYISGECTSTARRRSASGDDPGLARGARRAQPLTAPVSAVT